MPSNLSKVHPVTASIEVTRLGALFRTSFYSTAINAAMKAELAEHRRVVLRAEHRHRDFRRVAQTGVTHPACIQFRRWADAKFVLGVWDCVSLDIEPRVFLNVEHTIVAADA